MRISLRTGRSFSFSLANQDLLVQLQLESQAGQINLLSYFTLWSSTIATLGKFGLASSTLVGGRSTSLEPPTGWSWCTGPSAIGHDETKSLQYILH